MDWEVVSGITGIISAVCAIVSILFFNRYPKIDKSSKEKLGVISKFQLMAFLLVCSGWTLSCISFLYLGEPYGSFVSDGDYKSFFGFVIALPSGIILLNGLNLLKAKKL
ncbi:hypothetical protein WLQ65_01905 [Pseudoalteromonas piscicida]|uniref:hypothetical protein n=1 Tax=Pseudoalteromonas piscicida TaxID=43662 RepID=UPI0030C8D753